MRGISLEEPNFPFIENPLLPIVQDTPVTPTSLNLPGLDSNIINNPGIYPAATVNEAKTLLGVQQDDPLGNQMFNISNIEGNPKKSR